jgi:ferric-dicitrate binding protein FerR (iron transport regulator)
MVPPQRSVDVEPLSEARWARVEREVFAKLDAVEANDAGARAKGRGGARQVTAAWAAVGLAVAIAAAVAVVFGHRTWTRAEDREAVAEPRWDDRSTLATTDSTSQFTVGESSLTVAPRSLVMVTGDDAQGIDVVLDRGQVTCEAAPRKGRPAFRLEAGEVHVRVTGTKFTVTRDGSGTTVDVARGSVEVTSRGVVTQLVEGGHWPAAVAPATLGSAGVAPDEALAGASGEPVREHGRPHPRRKSRHRARSSEVAAAEEAESAEPAASASPPAASASAPSASQQAFEAAAKIERTNPDAAAAAYGELSNGTTPWAPNALFALARLEADRGRRAEAVRLFDAYLARYPHGINADDARELLRHIR